LLRERLMESSLGREGRREEGLVLTGAKGKGWAAE
jgi:hypothetical protein